MVVVAQVTCATTRRTIDIDFSFFAIIYLFLHAERQYREFNDERFSILMVWILQ